MSGRAKMRLADGRWSTARKTMNRRAYVPPHDRLDTRMTIMLPPALALVSPGPTGVCGVSIEPGPVAVAVGKMPKWVYRQMARYLLKVACFMELVLTAVVERGDEKREQQVIVQPDGIVEYPRGASRKPLRFEL